MSFSRKRWVSVLILWQSHHASSNPIFEILEGPSLKQGSREEMLLLTSLRRDVLWMIACSLLLQGESVAQNTRLDIAAPNTDVCSTRSINYIEPGLPSQCHRSSWPGASQTISTEEVDRLSPPLTESHSPANTATDDTAVQSLTATVPAEPRDTVPATDEENAPRTFVSFEDWKDQRAREANQEGLPDGSDQALDSAVDEVGREERLALRVEAVSGQINNIAAAATESSPTAATDQDQLQDPVPYDEDKAQYYRSKDAGKTCKERFSYSSFDAGATVLKTNTGAKNPKAILVENKDSYMLLECAAKNKFVIVELTDDILIDTVVLANYEFFSSMVRQFRVSVSDRYPVKLDKWKVLGTFEAKNSRDIQPFLVENPMIWAKYVRIEFLSHYGNEYYCPVSLLRVHGTRMLDSWKETESVTEDDEHDGIEAVNDGLGATTPSNENNRTQGGNFNDTEDLSAAPMNGTSVNPQLLILVTFRSNLVNQTCAVGSTGTSHTLDSTPSRPPTQHSSPEATSRPGITSSQNGHSTHKPAAAATATLQPVVGSANSTASTHGTSSVTTNTPPSQPKEIRSAAASQPAADSPKALSNSAGASKSASATPPVRSRNGTATSSSPASPTVQESFHKTVSKRLQLLETNVTLSLRYLEDQSRILQESQHLAERKQLAKVNLFLDNLNDTVLSELRNIRQQYDQIWQSTVIAIEGQKEQSQRELLALSSRLKLLADEVVFQKRMAIVQAVLLLSCLALVIFSRAASAQVPAIVHIPTTTRHSLQPRPVETYHGFVEGQGLSSSLDVAGIDHVSGRVNRQSVPKQRGTSGTAAQRAAGWGSSDPPFSHMDDLDTVPRYSTSVLNTTGFTRVEGGPVQVGTPCTQEQADMMPTDALVSAQKTAQGLSPPASPDAAGDGLQPRNLEATSGLVDPSASFSSELPPRTTPKPLPALPEDDNDE